MGDVSSAIPNDLIQYGGNAESHNGQLRDWARNVTTALSALRNSKPDPGLLPAVPDLGAVLNAYAVRKEAIDKFVYDVGMAFFEASNFGDLNAPVTVSDSALDKQLDQDEGAPGRSYADQVAQGKMTVEQALAMLGDDPIETAAFFKELGAPGTLDIAKTIHDPGTLQKFDEALATATNSPTWDPSFTDELVNGNYYDYEQVGPPELRWSLTADLLKYGVFSEDFLTKTSDAFLFQHRDDGINRGAQIALAALARNPDAALNYLNGTDPTDHSQTRLTHVLGSGIALTAQFPGGDENDFNKYENSIKDQLGLTVLAANDAPDATTDGQAKLLSSISKVPVSVVPDHFRDTVTKLIGLDINLFGDKLPSADPKHPENSTDSPLSWEDRQKLFLIAMYQLDPDMHQLVPNQDRIATLREEMMTWAMQSQNLATADPTVWLHNAASLNALMSDGLAAYPYYQEELAKEQEEFSSFFAGALFAVALPLGGVGLVELGVGELTVAGIEAATHIGLEITGDVTKDHNAPAWEVADEQLNQDLANTRASMVVSAYEHNPNAHWIPQSLRGKSLDDPELQHYLAAVAKADDTSDLPNQYKNSGTDVPQAGQLITQLNAYTGLFKAHDPQQVQEMLH
jgi:hypothetical protein